MLMRYLLIVAVVPVVQLAFIASAVSTDRERPNVVLIMSDDQGYGDFGATGNAVIETPNLDAMAARSASMKTFYVCPVCSPTRACLMTGRYNYRTRCIDTYNGRSMMDSEEVTLAEVLREAGYATGIFGKWHLGDSYPLRAIDQGFEEALVHKGGGLAQSSEPIENNRRYTDPLLFHNGQQVETKGFCTDVYFDAAIEFIEQSHADDRPFFAYVPTNAPHSPFHDVPEELYEHYRKKDLTPLDVDASKNRRRYTDHDTKARICAMITNIDQNVGRLFTHLERLGLTENTIVIYLVDNGPNSSRYVGPFRGTKATVHEGGIRTPFWMQWPAQLKPGATCDMPAAHIDVMPTLLDACNVDPPDGVQFDGRSFLPLLRGGDVTWPERYLALQAHRGNAPTRYHQFMIRDDRWKLLHASGFGKERFEGPPKFELYDLLADPGEARNLVDEHPAELQRLKQAYDVWFNDVSRTRPDNYAPPRIHIGTPHEDPTVLTRQDWRVRENKSLGHWEIHIADAGPYDVQFLFNPPVPAGRAMLTVGDVEHTLPVDAKSNSCTFAGLKLPTGDASLTATLTANGKTQGAYHVVLERK